MTGYGRGEVGNFKVEVRSTNHRNIDIRINIPSYLYYYEPEIRNIVKEKFCRGRIEIFVPKSEGINVRLKINESLAKEYYQALVSLRDKLSLSDNIGINSLISLGDIFLLEESEVEVTIFQEALEAALEELKRMRLREGKNLADDINERIKILKKQVQRVEEQRTEIVKNSKQALAEKLRTLFDNISIDDQRLIQEAAILVERSDITEEFVRIKSHLEHMESVLKDGDVIGKKIDFLSQELNRELNTIGSKAPSADISALVIEMKHEIEKIREQTQNLQ